MKKVGLILLSIVISLAMVVYPVFAAPGNGNSGKSNHVTGNNSGRNYKVKVDVKKEKLENKARTEVKERVQSQLQNITPEQKQKIRQRFQEQKKQIIKRQLKDVETHWAKDAIQKAQSLGFIKGYEDDTFKPDASVSSTEAMVMAVRLAESLDLEDEVSDEEVIEEEVIEEEVIEEEVIEEEVIEEEVIEEEVIEEENTDEGEEVAEEEEVPEVPGWAKNAAKKAFRLKIINQNRFHSQVQATRAQSAVMLAKAFGLEPVDISEMTFVDGNLISSEDIGYILALKEAGIIKGTPDGKFNPNNSVTRAQFAAMLSRITDMVENDVVAEDELDQTTEEETTDQTIQPAEDSETTEQTDESGTTQEETQSSDNTEEITEEDSASEQVTQ